MSENNGGPAFPCEVLEEIEVKLRYIDGKKISDKEWHKFKLLGMSLRDYFASKAMQGLIVHYGVSEKRSLVNRSVELADNLIEVLKENQ